MANMYCPILRQDCIEHCGLYDPIGSQCSVKLGFSGVVGLLKVSDSLELVANSLENIATALESLALIAEEQGKPIRRA